MQRVRLVVRAFVRCWRGVVDVGIGICRIVVDSRVRGGRTGSMKRMCLPYLEGNTTVFMHQGRLREFLDPGNERGDRAM